MAEFLSSESTYELYGTLVPRRRRASWSFVPSRRVGSVFDQDDHRYDDSRLRILQTLAFRTEEAGDSDGAPDIDGTTWRTEVRDHLPGDLACVHVFKDDEHYGFVARNTDELDAVFASVSEAEAAATQSMAMLEAGVSSTDNYTILPRR